MMDAITIRHATAADRGDVRFLAQLDGRPEPEGETLLALVGGELRAALPLEGGEAIADPFHHTRQLVELLRLRIGHEPGEGRAPAREWVERLLPVRA